MQTFLMDLSFNGAEVTPNLNKLAKEGMFFKNFYNCSQHKELQQLR